MLIQTSAPAPVQQGLSARNARQFALAIVIAIATLLGAAGSATANRWSPGETIGNISGAEKWCGMPWEDASSCPTPLLDGKHFNMHITPWLSDPRNTCPSCRGAMQLNGLAAHAQGQPGTTVITKAVACGQVAIVFDRLLVFSAITEIKEVGVGNEAPAAARGADVSFRCTATYFNRDPWVLKFKVPVKWWVNIKTPKSSTERGWVYIEAKDGSFDGIMVPVTSHPYSHSVDVCTPNSDPETCRDLTG